MDLVPDQISGFDLAHYRTLLPLYHDEQDAFSPWAAFLSGGADALDELRNLDLYDLRHVAGDAEKDMTGWDSPRGQVSDDFLAMLGEALGEFVSEDATWTLLRWQGYKNDVPARTTVTIHDLDYDQQEMDLVSALASIKDLRMPEFMWCSTNQFGWGSPLLPDWGVMTMKAEHYIRHFAPRGFESFYVTPDAVMPDNVGD